MRVEQASLGNVFMCTHGGSRYGNDGCRRTYLSQRDLQAHINHRHLRLTSAPPEKEPQKISTVSLTHPQAGSRNPGSHIPALHTRSNLVSIPIQDSTSSQQGYFVPPPSTAAYTYTYPNQTGHTSYGSQSFYAAPAQVGSSYPNFQQPPPTALPPPPMHSQQYDSGQTFQNSQWNGAAGSMNPPYYR